MLLFPLSRSPGSRPLELPLELTPPKGHRKEMRPIRPPKLVWPLDRTGNNFPLQWHTLQPTHSSTSLSTKKFGEKVKQQLPDDNFEKRFETPNNRKNSPFRMNVLRYFCHDPLPVEILLAALEYRDSAEDMEKGRVNTFKLC